MIQLTMGQFKASKTETKIGDPALTENNRIEKAKTPMSTKIVAKTSRPSGPPSAILKSSETALQNSTAKTQLTNSAHRETPAAIHAKPGRGRRADELQRSKTRALHPTKRRLVREEEKGGGVVWSGGRPSKHSARACFGG